MSRGRFMFDVISEHRSNEKILDGLGISCESSNPSKDSQRETGSTKLLYSKNFKKVTINGVSHYAFVSNSRNVDPLMRSNSNPHNQDLRVQELYNRSASLANTPLSLGYTGSYSGSIYNEDTHSSISDMPFGIREHLYTGNSNLLPYNHNLLNNHYNIDSNFRNYLEKPGSRWNLLCCTDRSFYQRARKNWLAILISVVHIFFFIKLVYFNTIVSNRLLHKTSDTNIMFFRPETLVAAGSVFAPCMRVSTFSNKSQLPCPVVFNEVHAKNSTRPLDIFCNIDSYCNLLQHIKKNDTTNTSIKDTLTVKKKIGDLDFKYQSGRFIYGMIIPSGLLQLIFILIVNLTVFIEVQKRIGSLITLFVYLYSGITGYLFAANYLSTIAVITGPVPSAFGIYTTYLMLFAKDVLMDSSKDNYMFKMIPFKGVGRKNNHYKELNPQYTRFFIYLLLMVLYALSPF